MFTRRAVLTLGGGAAAWLGAGTSSFAAGAGQITKLSGRAVAIAGTAERALAIGAPVQVGDLVQTAANSRLAMKLGDDTFINLGPSTKLRIEPHLVDVGGQFELIERQRADGAHATGRRATAQGGAEEPVRSHRGAWHEILRGPIALGKFAVFVAEGRVDLITKARTVALNPGYGSDVGRPGDAASPAGIWKAARIRDAYVLTTGSAGPAKAK